MLLLSGGMALLSSARNYLRAVRSNDEKRRSGLAVVKRLEKDVNILLEDRSDSPFSKGIGILERNYASYDLHITDVSSGINAGFLPEEFLKHEEIASLMRRVPASIVRYGWMQSSFCSPAAVRQARESFGISDAAEIFPLINSFPLANVHFLSEELLRALCAYYKIEGGGEKSRRLYQVAGAALLTDSDIAAVLEVETSHGIFAFLGCKSSFFKVLFRTESCTVQAVFCAVPGKEENRREVVRYNLVERSVFLD
jgi:hypothetical protein